MKSVFLIRLSRDLKLGVKNLLLHKLRSVLTMLGLVFGVGSVIAMLAIGEGQLGNHQPNPKTQFPKYPVGGPKANR